MRGLWSAARDADPLPAGWAVVRSRAADLARSPRTAGAMARSTSDDPATHHACRARRRASLTMTRATTGCGISRASASAAICFTTSRIIAHSAGSLSDAGTPPAIFSSDSTRYLTSAATRRRPCRALMEWFHRSTSCGPSGPDVRKLMITHPSSESSARVRGLFPVPHLLNRFNFSNT
jgi:hypothetical protein